MIRRGFSREHDTHRDASLSCYDVSILFCEKLSCAFFMMRMKCHMWGLEFDADINWTFSWECEEMKLENDFMRGKTKKGLEKLFKFLSSRLVEKSSQKFQEVFLKFSSRLTQFDFSTYSEKIHLRFNNRLSVKFLFGVIWLRRLFW